MDVLPLSLHIAGQPCLVVGGGETARRKAELLAAAGAAVAVVAREASDAMRALCRRHGFTLDERSFAADDVFAQPAGDRRHQRPRCQRGSGRRLRPTPSARKLRRRRQTIHGALSGHRRPRPGDGGHQHRRRIAHLGASSARAHRDSAAVLLGAARDLSCQPSPTHQGGAAGCARSAAILGSRHRFRAGGAGGPRRLRTVRSRP